ncbi:MAG TPA: hypothetical protein VM487_22385 [Phycisphaerae bacterium]|nr:hypothetical protein [Phycisphaerae bacterium]
MTLDFSNALAGAGFSLLFAAGVLLNLVVLVFFMVVAGRFMRARESLAVSLRHFVLAPQKSQGIGPEGSSKRGDA